MFRSYLENETENVTCSVHFSLDLNSPKCETTRFDSQHEHMVALSHC